MRPFPELEKRYQTDAAFNKLVRTFRALLQEHGFVPSEIREAMFLAQYQYESNQAELIIRTQKDWEELFAAREFSRRSLADGGGKNA